MTGRRMTGRRPAKGGSRKQDASPRRDPCHLPRAPTRDPVEDRLPPGFTWDSEPVFEPAAEPGWYRAWAGDAPHRLSWDDQMEAERSRDSAKPRVDALTDLLWNRWLDEVNRWQVWATMRSVQIRLALIRHFRDLHGPHVERVFREARILRMWSHQASPGAAQRHVGSFAEEILDRDRLRETFALETDTKVETATRCLDRILELSMRDLLYRRDRRRDASPVRRGRNRNG